MDGPSAARPAVPDLALLLDRCAELATAAASGRRRVLGIAGTPGAGKTTLVTALLCAAAHDPRLAGRVAHVPMDGFHLPGAELERLGRLGRKGAPDTFDAPGYAAVIASVRGVPRAVVTAPAFDHAVGEPQADAIEVASAADLVVTEGNYLLLDDAAWHPVRQLLDETWFCALDDDRRRDRLVARHVDAGRAPEDAVRWVSDSDEANARLVAAGDALADLVLVDGRIVPPQGPTPT